MTGRRRFEQTPSLKERLLSFAKEMTERASRLPSGKEKDELLKKASQAKTAAHIEDWANSRGLKPPD